jgi:hypothetical protein
MYIEKKEGEGGGRKEKGEEGRFPGGLRGNGQVDNAAVIGIDVQKRLSQKFPYSFLISLSLCVMPIMESILSPNGCENAFFKEENE